MSLKLDTPRIMVTATTDSVKPTGVSYHRTSTARKWQLVRHARGLSSDNRTRMCKLDLLATVYKAWDVGVTLDVACISAALISTLA